MPIPGWLKEGTKWGLGTSGGVLLTLLITFYAERARPSAEIAQISITAADGDLANASLKRIVEVPLTDDLFSALAQSAWTEAFRDPSDILVKVISKLNRNKEYVEGYLRHADDYNRLREKMTLLLNGEKSPKAAESFFDYWQQVDGFIYGSVRSQMRYGSSALRKINCDQGSAELPLRKLTYRKDPDDQYLARLMAKIRGWLLRGAPSKDQSGLKLMPDSIVGAQVNREAPSGTESASQGQESTSFLQGDEHIYSVTKVGGRYKSRFDIRSNLDENEIVTEHEERCAESVMAALADFDKERLNAILDLTDQEAKGVELHRKIQSDIEKYIKGFSFWKVAMLLSNRGKSPISFSPNATLYVDLSGTKINHGNNLVVNLKSVNKNGDGDPITVPGGDSRSVSFISSDLVKDYGEWKDVIDAFEQSSRNAVVVLYPQTGDWQQDKPMFSPVRNFGPPPKASPKEAQGISAHFTSKN